ncbi:MAG: autotransporter-associated beta strand repeat-containing protein, partial [Terrimicrobiaceae bacterium]
AGGGGGERTNYNSSLTDVNSGGGGGFGGGGGGGLLAAGGGGFGAAGGSISNGFKGGNGWGAQYDENSNFMGASLGGGIFVMFGADLTITGSGTFHGNSGRDFYVFLSPNGTWADNDYVEENLGGMGTDLFVMSGAKATLAPGAGETLRFQGTIDDDNGAFGHNGTIYRVEDVGADRMTFFGAEKSNGPGALIKIGSSSNPGGTVIFEGRTSYAGGTEMHSGTLIVDGNTGSILSGSDLSFTGKSEFRYDNTNSGSGDNKTQFFGTVAFNGGDGAVANIKGDAASSSLNIATVTRAAGATGNFVVGDGTNGSDNKLLVGGAAGVRSPGLFFGGNNYATVDNAGYVRGINYGVDANSILSNGTTISGTPTSSSNVKLADAITAQSSIAINTLNLDSHDLDLGGGQTLTVNGIVQSGGSAAISGGNGISKGGSESDLVIRTDTESDFLSISNSISTPNLTKSGAGTLLLSGNNTITGTTWINDGILVAGSNSALGVGSVTVKTGGVLIAGSGVTLGNALHLQGGLYAQTVDTGDSFVLKATSQLEAGRHTTAEILGGIASSVTSLENTFSETSNALNDTLRLTDVYAFQGTGSDVFVLQLSFTATTPDAYLGWLSGNQWVNARDGNTGNNPLYASQFDGTFDEFQTLHGLALSTYIGAWGVDLSGGVTSTWAVLNHNSDFTVVPEPSSAALLLLAAAGLLAKRRR